MTSVTNSYKISVTSQQRRWKNGDNSGRMTNEVALSLQNQRKQQLNIYNVWQIHKKTSQCAKLNIKADLKRKNNEFKCDIRCKNGWVNVQSCQDKGILWRWIRPKGASRRARLSTRGWLNVQKSSCDAELSVKWQVVAQKSSTRGRLIVQFCQEKDVLWRWIRRKVTSGRAKLPTRGGLNVQSCLWKSRFVVLN